MEIMKEHSDFIEQYWEVLAACAWREFKLHGRGALVFGALSEPDDFIYMPLSMLEGEPLMGGFASLAKEYDPMQEVVVILGVPPSVTAIKGGPLRAGTPPALYERLKEVLEEM
jgi:hypothetical protein